MDIKIKSIKEVGTYKPIWQVRVEITINEGDELLEQTFEKNLFFISGNKFGYQDGIWAYVYPNGYTYVNTETNISGEREKIFRNKKGLSKLLKKREISEEEKKILKSMAWKILEEIFYYEEEEEEERSIFSRYV